MTSHWFEGVMYTAYGDDSADETKQRVFAIAGLFGNKNDWHVFRSKWRMRTKGKSFHATDCDTDHGQYANTPHAENKKLYADLSHIIANSNLMGYSIAIDLIAYKELLSASLDKEAYYLCFGTVIINITRRALICIPRDHIKFTFDRNQQIEYNAAAIYDTIINKSYPYFKEYLDDEITFATNRTIGIQAVDLIARESMKLLDNQIGPVSRPTRLSTQVLQSCQRITFDQFRRAWFEDIVTKAASNNVTYPRSEYQEWLSQQGLNPTMANKLRYEIFRKSIASDA